MSVNKYNPGTGQLEPIAGLSSIELASKQPKVLDTPITIAGTSNTTVEQALGSLNNSKADLASPAFTGTPTALTAAAGTSSLQIATTEFVMNAIGGLDALIFKGTIGTGGTVTTLPAVHEVGWSYKVITAGTYAGHAANVGDLIICTTAGAAAADADWAVAPTNTDGMVIGPVSSSDGHVALFDGSSGTVIKDGGAIDVTPTTNSTNLVTSGGVKTALDAKQDTLQYDNVPTAASTKMLTSGSIKTALDTKQDTLDFDTTPTQNSVKPVTSNGIYNAISDATTASYSVTLAANAWDANHQQEITINGLTCGAAGDTPPLIQCTNNQDEYVYIEDATADATTHKILFTASQTPTSNIGLRIIDLH